VAGKPENYPKYAAELVVLAPDVILAPGGSLAPMIQATRTVPIVFVPGRQFALDLMRRTKKESRIELAEGLSRLGGPRCVTTVSTVSNHDRRKLAISSPRAILVRAR